jgi:hypothetical protein
MRRRRWRRNSAYLPEQPERILAAQRRDLVDRGAPQHRNSAPDVEQVGALRAFEATSRPR